MQIALAIGQDLGLCLSGPKSEAINRGKESVEKLSSCCVPVLLDHHVWCRTKALTTMFIIAQR